MRSGYSAHMQRTLRIIGLCLILGSAFGCSTPSALPAHYQLPTLLRSEIPLAQAAILKYAQEHDDHLPGTVVGEQLAMRAMAVRESSVNEVDAAGSPVTVAESIDGVAYLYRPAQDNFILTVCGRVLRTVPGAPSPMCAWFVYQGRYSEKGEVIEDRTSYLENTELFIDSMRATTHPTAWNSSAWAINRCYTAVVAANGLASADGMVEHFVKAAIATGRARVPTGMPPRQAAFGGTVAKSSAAPPVPQ